MFITDTVRVASFQSPTQPLGADNDRTTLDPSRGFGARRNDRWSTRRGGGNRIDRRCRIGQFDQNRLERKTERREDGEDHAKAFGR